MGTVSRVHTFSSGAILTAAQLNNEFDNLLTSSAINGGLDATNLGVTAGQATASKALVVDGSRNLADGTAGNRINNLALSGTFESTGLVTATAGITSGSNIVSDTDSTDDLGTTGVRWRNLYVDDVTVTNNVSIGGTLTLTGGLTLNGNVAIGDSASDTLTVNSTITSNLIFTDNTYDIGASGATRPRDLHLSRNALMGGTLGVTGLITATGGVSGALTGNVTGNVTGNLTGNVTGNVTGDVTGDVTGNISGNVTGGTISGSTGTFSGDLTVATNVFFVDASGSAVGLGTNSLNAYNSAHRALELGTRGANIAGRTDSDTIYVNANSFQHTDGNWKYNSTDEASQYYQTGGTHNWRRAASGTAGTNITWTTQAVLDSTGLGIGTSSPEESLTIHGGGSTASTVNITGGASGNDNATLASDYSLYYQIDANNSVGSRRYEWRVGGKGYSDGSALMTLLSSGNLGLSAQSPTVKIHASGSSTNSALRLDESNSSASSYLGYIDTSGNFGIDVNGGGYLRFAVGSAERLRIDASGLVAIGSTSPSSYSASADDFVIAKDASAVGMTIRSSSTGTGNIFFANSEASNANNGVIIFNHSTGEFSFDNYVSGSHYTFNLSNSEKLRLDSTGLGVGSNSPQALIHAQAADGAVGGAIKYTADSVASGYLSASTDGTVLATDTADITFRLGVTGNDPTDTGAEAVRIKSTGMGVLCSPSAPLAVASKASTYEGMELVTPSGDGSGKFQFGVHDLGGSAGRGIEFRRGGSDGFDTLSLAINDAGNMGLGLTPSTFSVGTAFEVGGAGNALWYSGSAGDIILRSNVYYNSGDKYGANGHATQIKMNNSGAFEFYTAPSGTANAAVTLSKIMELSQGSLILEDSSSNSNPFIRVKNDAREYNLQVAGARSDSFEIYDNTAGTQRLTIDSSGNLIVGTTVSTPSGNNVVGIWNSIGTGSYAGVLRVGHSTSNVSGSGYVDFWYNGGNIGSISQNGTTAVAYNTTSDYRIKENVVGITDGITRIKSLKPSRFNFIAEADRTVDGFVAHEVSDIVPEAITGAKDAVDDKGNPQYQGIDQSKLVPLLTAALQEAIKKIETLETKVAALEAA